MTVFNLDTRQPIAFLPMAGGSDVIKFDPGLKRIYVRVRAELSRCSKWDDPDHYRKLEDFRFRESTQFAVDTDTHRVYAPSRRPTAKALRACRV